MSLFNLVNENVRLVHAHDRMEHHGEERKLALDLSLEIAASNSILHKLAPNLKDSFYMQDDGAVQDMINPDHKPKLRNPLIINPIKLDLELPCVRFGVLEDGSSDEEIIFLDAKCNKFELTLKEGGTAIIKFRIQKSLVDIEDLSKLKLLQEEIIKVNLEIQEQEAPKESEPEAYSEHSDNVIDMFAGPASGAQEEGDDDQSQADDEGDPRTPEELAQDEAARKVAMGIADDQEYNERYEKAAAFVRGRSNVSTSVIKREFKISQLEAVRLLDQMESEGIVGEAAGNGVREVFALPAATA